MPRAHYLLHFHHLRGLISVFFIFALSNITLCAFYHNRHCFIFRALFCGLFGAFSTFLAATITPEVLKSRSNPEFPIPTPPLVRKRIHFRSVIQLTGRDSTPRGRAAHLPASPEDQDHFCSSPHSLLWQPSLGSSRVQSRSPATVAVGHGAHASARGRTSRSSLPDRAPGGHSALR